MKGELPLCRHCNRYKAHRPRRLCWSCYERPAVRVMYATDTKFGRRGVGIGLRGEAMPAPTNCPPGTPEKLAVLEQRAARGERLFHPLDA